MGPRWPEEVSTLEMHRPVKTQHLTKVLRVDFYLEQIKAGAQ